MYGNAKVVFGAVTAVVVAIVFLAGGLLPAQAGHYDCGDTVTVNDTLDSDVGPCVTDPALTVQGPATLDMKGYEVSCAASTTGVEISGSGATLKKGFVSQCQTGVVIGGTGSHEIYDVTSYENDDDGFRATSSNNMISKSWALKNGRFGFFITGSSNELAKNMALENTMNGFEIRATGNDLSKNIAYLNSLSGFFVRGNSHTFEKNRAIHNNRNGFIERDATGNIFSKNVALLNGEGNPVDAGIYLAQQSVAATVEKNITRRNRNGIRVQWETAVDADITYNKALGNEVFDLFDIHSDCDNNTWSDNVFETSNPVSCID